MSLRGWPVPETWALPDVSDGVRLARPRKDASILGFTTFRAPGSIDGHTFKIAYEGEPTSVRIAGIDAPEPREPDGPAATAALRRLIDGKLVRIEFTGERKRDSFGRLVCRVYVGEWMLDNRHARPYKRS